MFIPNTTCKHWTKSKRMDLYGKSEFDGPRTQSCAVITFNTKIDKTSVRADSSGSRGKGEEDQGDAVILFPVGAPIKDYDIVSLDGEVLEIVGIFPRRNILGRLDHLEVKLRKSQLP